MTPLVILTGPTAVGKTGLSIALAKAIGAEIINADSMQVYRGMDIGSAKISPGEMDGVPHHLIDILDPDQDFSVYDFQQATKAAITEIRGRGRIPLLVGGTGFYIQALLKDVDFNEEAVDEAYRKELQELAAEEPLKLHQMLSETDPEAAAQIHPNNLKRVMRALEFARVNGSSISEHNREQKSKPSPYNYAYFVLERDRAELYRRIDARVDQMMEEGLLQETARLKDAGLREGMTAAHGLGYRELLQYLEGGLDLEEAVRLIKQNTRHYAKRQLTWFRREPDVIRLDADRYSQEELLEQIQKILMGKKILL
ncbi:MAG: tRNA (adenosine(37)-N6)-dimethylallyltransferase MiaA [Lachnospiraceae bacterium]|nr:tRNA (adenosine(37)-N6)-dimethylallyltransferase MiaA [Lachnospiraceae bacterium]